MVTYGPRAASLVVAVHSSDVAQGKRERHHMISGVLKLLGGAAGIIFLIGLLVVIGLFALIF